MQCTLQGVQASLQKSETTSTAKHLGVCFQVSTAAFHQSKENNWNEAYEMLYEMDV